MIKTGFSSVALNTRGRGRRGFTLIELMVTMCVSSVIMVTLTAILGAVTRQWGVQVSRGRAIQSANLAMAQMTKELRGAVLFQAIDAPKTCTFVFPANTDAGGNFVPAWNRTYLRYASGYRVHYYLSDLTGTAASGGVLWRETNPLPIGAAGWVRDTASSLVPGSLTGGALTPGAKGCCDSITALTFTVNNAKPNTVLASLTVSYQEGKVTSAYTLTRAIYLGNHN